MKYFEILPNKIPTETNYEQFMYSSLNSTCKASTKTWPASSIPDNWFMIGISHTAGHNLVKIYKNVGALHHFVIKFWGPHHTLERL